MSCPPHILRATGIAPRAANARSHGITISEHPSTEASSIPGRARSRSRIALGIRLPAESALSEHHRWFYGADAPPSWGQDADGNPPKTPGEAEHERELLAKALRRSSNWRAHALARQLDICSPFNPCFSGGCPICNRANQRLFVEASRNLFRDNGDDMLAITVVWADAAVGYGQLVARNVFEATHRRLLQAFRTINVPAVGGFDISANLHESNIFVPHWMPHAFIFVPRAPMRARVREFRGFFPANNLVSRPVHNDTFDGNAAALAYALKPDFFTRVTLAGVSLFGET